MSVSAPFVAAHEVFTRFYCVSDRLFTFTTRWHSKTGIQLPAFGIGEAGAQAWFAYFLRERNLRAQMLRLIANDGDLRPEHLSPADLERLAQEAESTTELTPEEVALLQRITLLPTPTMRHIPQLNLSPQQQRLLGRDQALANIVDIIRRECIAGRQAVIVFSPPEGLPSGTGKTTLALHTARELYRRNILRGGQVKARSLGGNGKPQTTEQIMRDVIHKAGARLGEHEDPRRAYEALFQEAGGPLYKGVLLLEDVSDAAQVTSLLPSSSDCAVLITTKLLCRELTNVTHFELVDVLTLEVAHKWLCDALMQGRLGKQVSKEEREQLQDIAKLCGQIPMALTPIDYHLRQRARTAPISELLALYRANRSNYSNDLDASLATGMLLLDHETQRACLHRCWAFGSTNFWRQAFDSIYDSAQAMIDGRYCVTINMSRLKTIGIRVR